MMDANLPLPQWLLYLRICFSAPWSNHQKKNVNINYEPMQLKIISAITFWRKDLNMKRESEYPPPLQGSLKPLKKIMLLPNLFKTLSIFCTKSLWQLNNSKKKYLGSSFLASISIRNWIEFSRLFVELKQTLLKIFLNIEAVGWDCD